MKKLLTILLALIATGAHAATNTILTRGTPPNGATVQAKDTSAGAGDAAKVPLLNSLGFVDYTMLPTSGATAGTYGSATQVPLLTVDLKGRVTSVSNVTITGAAPGGAAGGDLSGSYPNPGVAKVNGSTPGGTCISQFIRSLSSSAVPTCASIAGADLPNPGASTLGGIESYAAVTHQWINTISTSGVPSSTQPAEADITNLVSDLALKAPLASPALTGSPTAPTQLTADNSTLISTDQWVKNQGYVTAATAPVTSVFGRTGAVTAQSGDYDTTEITGLSATYSVEKYGAVCDGSTDDSTAVQSAINAAQATGGTVTFPAKTCRINSQLSIPNDSASVLSHQRPVRLKGSGAHMNGSGVAAPFGGTVLDLRTNAVDGKVISYGLGLLEVEDITFYDQGTNSNPYLFVTNTTLHVTHSSFVGNPSKSGTTCNQDAIVLGGTAHTFGNTPSDSFQGYGTVIGSNFFDRVQRAVYGRVDFNGAVVRDNIVFQNSGSALSGGAAIELDGGVYTASGNTIAANLIELDHYVYGIKLQNGSANVLVGNSGFDGGSATAVVRIETTSIRNVVIPGLNGAPLYLSDAQTGTSTNTYLSIDSSHLSNLGPAHFYDDTGAAATTFDNALFAGGNGKVTIQSATTQTGGAFSLRALRSAAESTCAGGKAWDITYAGDIDFYSSSSCSTQLGQITNFGRSWLASGTGAAMSQDSGSSGSNLTLSNAGVIFQTHAATQYASIASNGINLSPASGGVTFGDAINLSVGSTTGTKIGTGTLQKLGFFNASPVAQQTGDISTALSNLGLVATPSIATGDITGLAASATTDTTNASNITSGTLPNARIVALPNANLANSAITIGGTSTSLGGSVLGNVTNDAQTKASIVPNTAPSAGQMLAGNAGGTAYSPVTLSGSGATATLSSSGVLTLSAIPNATLSNSAITIAGTSTSLGGSITQDTITGLSSTGIVKRTGANALAIATAGTDYAGVTDVQVFTSSGTWTKPAGAQSVTVYGVGPGGGGGSGRRGATSSNVGGGGGGSGGACVWTTIPAANVTSTVTVTVPAGGAGGNAQTVDSTDGNPGVTPSSTQFGAYLLAARGALGQAGTAGTANGGGASTGILNGGAGGASSATGGQGNNGSNGNCAGGGGAGGGITSGNSPSAGGNGGIGDVVSTLNSGGNGGAATGATGSTGSVSTATNQPVGGGAGGGGGAQLAGVGGSGGACAGYGSGGAGGAGANNGNNSGAGSQGCPGLIVVVTTR